jgi:hypothetical protein
MTKYSILNLLIVILIENSRGQICEKEIDGNILKVRNCDHDSYGNLAVDSAPEKIQVFNAGWQNNSFPNIDNKMFEGLINLDKVKLYGCKIEAIEENSFSYLKSLGELSLWGNQIKTLHENTFDKLENLKVLKLSKNLIEHVPAKLFKNTTNLRELWLNGNRIKVIPDGLFDTLTELQELAIHSNELKVIHQNTFKQNKKLEKLWLSNNEISSIAEGAFCGLVKLEFLNLKDNFCISETYNEWNPVKISSELSDCYNNYSYITPRSAMETEPEPPSKASIYLTVASGAIILLVGAIIFKIKSQRKTDNVEFNSEESCHYYSKPDSPEEIARAQGNLEKEQEKDIYIDIEII